MNHISRDQEALKLVYPMADLLGVRLGLHFNSNKMQYEIVRIPGDKPVPFVLGPVTLAMPLEIKASYCSYPVGAIWLKVLRSLYGYVVYDDSHSMTYFHIVNCDTLGGGTKELHAKFKGVHPLKVLDEIKRNKALVRVYARGKHEETWLGWGVYGDYNAGRVAEVAEADPVDSGLIEKVDPVLGENPSSGPN